MGLVKNHTRFDFVEYWLEKYGFVFDSRRYGEPSYEIVYLHSDEECLTVTVCFPERKVYLYNEYDCGGLLWEKELDIPEGIYDTDEEAFINWLDEELDIE